MTGICNAINSGQALASNSNVTFLTLTTSHSSGTGILNTSTDSGAAAMPILDQYRNSASPAAADIIGQVIFNGRDSASNKQEYARIEGVIVSPTSTAENGQLNLYTENAGASVLQTSWLNTGGQYRGNNTNTAAPAGFVGEIISSTIASGSAVTLSNNTAANVTSISLTAGNWNVTANVVFNGTLTGTQSIASISATSATLGTAVGSDTANSPTVATAASDYMLSVPDFNLSLSATTTYYMVAQAAFTVGTAKAYGKIIATRIA